MTWRRWSGQRRALGSLYLITGGRLVGTHPPSLTELGECLRIKLEVKYFSTSLKHGGVSSVRCVPGEELSLGAVFLNLCLHGSSKL